MSTYPRTSTRWKCDFQQYPEITMKYIILVLWTFSLFLLMFSSFPFRVDCRPTRALGVDPPRPQSAPLILLPSSSNIYFNNHHTSPTTMPCPVLEGPSATRFNPWPDHYIPDITAKVWEAPIVLEGTARSRSEVRPDGTFGVTFDLHRVVKGDAPLLRRRRQFRLQFLDNPNPPLDTNPRNRDFLSGPQGRKNPNKNNKFSNSSITSSSPKSSRSGSSISNINNSRNNNLNNIYNSHSNPRSGSLATSSLSTKQLHPPTSQSHQLQLYQQQQSRSLQYQQRQRQIVAQQQQQFRQSSRPNSPPPPPSRGFRNASGAWGSSGSTNFQVRPYSSTLNNRNSSVASRRSSRSLGNDALPPSSPGYKCVPPKATVKTGRKYYVFAAKVEQNGVNHFIAVFSPELANKRNSKAVEGILCKGCGKLDGFKLLFAKILHKIQTTRQILAGSLKERIFYRPKIRCKSSAAR